METWQLFTLFFPIIGHKRRRRNLTKNFLQFQYSPRFLRNAKAENQYTVGGIFFCSQSGTFSFSLSSLPIKFKIVDLLSSLTTVQEIKGGAPDSPSITKKSMMSLPFNYDYDILCIVICEGKEYTIQYNTIQHSTIVFRLYLTIHNHYFIFFFWSSLFTLLLWHTCCRVNRSKFQWC